MLKKAQVEGFNWIFVLIAGGIILMFFIGAAVWFTSVSEDRETVKLTSYASSLLKSSLETTNHQEERSVALSTLSFSCFHDECDETYGCASAFNGITTEKDPIFTMREFETDTISTWTMDYETPFKVDTLLYITHPRIRYIIVTDGPTELYRPLVEAFEDNSYVSSVIVGSVSDVSIGSYDLNRFVVFTDSTSDLSRFEPYDILYVTGNDVGFSAKNSADVMKRMKYYSLPLLLGAVFSEDADFYECNLNKLVYATKRLANIYSKRTEIIDNATSPSACTPLYFDAQTEFDRISDTLTNSTLDMSSYGMIENTNSLLVRKGCARVY